MSYEANQSNESNQATASDGESRRLDSLITDMVNEIQTTGELERARVLNTRRRSELQNEILNEMCLSGERVINKLGYLFTVSTFSSTISVERLMQSSRSSELTITPITKPV